MAVTRMSGPGSLPDDLLLKASIDEGAIDLIQ